MKHLLSIIFFTIIFSGVYGQSLNCKKFRNGTFKIVADGLSGEVILTRKGDLQRETVEKVDGYSEFIVKWLDDCTYTLTPTIKTFERFPGMPKDAFLTVKITEVKENSYVQTSTSNFADFVLTSEIIKIK